MDGGWMGGWIDGLAIGWMHISIDELLDEWWGWMYRLMCGCMCVWMD